MATMLYAAQDVAQQICNAASRTRLGRRVPVAAGVGGDERRAEVPDLQRDLRDAVALRRARLEVRDAERDSRRRAADRLGIVGDADAQRRGVLACDGDEPLERRLLRPVLVCRQDVCRATREFVPDGVEAHRASGT